MSKFNIDTPYSEILLSDIKFQQLPTTPQDKVYHAEGDVWVHTCLVLDALKSIWSDLSLDEKEICFNACAYHDIAKSYTTVIHEDGGISAKSHSTKGATDTRVLMYKANVDSTFREKVCSLVTHHQDPFFIFANKSDLPPELLVRKLSVICDTKLLYYVAKADIIGRDYFDKQKVLDDIEQYKDLCIELDCFGKPYNFYNDITRVKYFDSNGGVSPDHFFWREHASNVYVTVGIPASGKSTYVNKHFSHLPVVSYDSILEELNLEYCHDNVMHAVRIGKERIKTLLRNKQDFVVCNTTITKQYQENLANITKQYGGNIHFLIVERPYNTVISANNKRNSTVRTQDYNSFFLKWDLPTLDYAHTITFV